MADRSQFADLLTPGFRQIYDDKFKEVPMKMEQVMKINTSEKPDEKDSSVAWFGLATPNGEHQPVDYEDPIQGYDKTYTHTKYGKAFRVTYEMFEDDLYNIMNKRPAALGICMRRTAENLAAGIFNNAFSTSYLGADGDPLVSTLHGRPDGGTDQSNASATGIVLSEPNLETAILAMQNQLDDKGQKIDVFPKIILVPINLRKTARLIVESTLRQGTADNDVNVYKDEFKIVDWIYLSSTTAWFLIDPTAYDINWFWRRRPTFKDGDLFDTDVAVYKSTMRLSNGWSNWRGVWGSKGDAAAYSS